MHSTRTLPDSLEASVLRKFRRKLLQNYTSWCSYLGRKSQVSVSRRRNGTGNSETNSLRRELLYVSLYLLIWGESANLCFAPECICYIFHHIAMELNLVLDEETDPNTGQSFLPSIYGDCAFLKRVVMPIYDTIELEVKSSRNGVCGAKVFLECV